MNGITRPAKGDDVKKFMDSVQPVSPSIRKQSWNTVKSIKNTLGSLAATVFSGITWPFRKAGYLAGNILAIPAAVANQTTSWVDKFNNMIQGIFSGDKGKSTHTEAHAAPAAAAAGGHH